MHSTASYLQHHTDRTARLRRSARPRRQGAGSAPDRGTRSSLLALLRPAAAQRPVAGAAC